MWERSFGVDARSVGLDRLEDEVKVVDELVEYVLTCMKRDARTQIEQVMQTRDLGIDVNTGGLGILFPSHLIDMWPGPIQPDADGQE